MALEFTNSHWYAARLTQWTRMRDCFGGEDLLKSRDRREYPNSHYIPVPTGWDSEKYREYLKRGVYFNGVKITINTFTGLGFRNEPTSNVEEYFDDQILNDLTLTGMNEDDVAKWMLETRLKTGFLGVLVDHPQGKKGATVADAEKLNFRPSWRLYECEAIRQVIHEDINNKRVLTKVVLREVSQAAANDGTDGVVEVERKRILELVDGRYRQRIETERDGKKEVDQVIDVQRYGKPITYIPFFFCPDFKGVKGPEEPPFLDLANHSLDHYRVTTDHRWGLHRSGMFQPWIAGVQPEDLPKTIGVEVWGFEHSETKVGMIDYSTTFDGHEKTEAAVETRMARSGARVLAPESIEEETATAANIRNVSETVTLGDMVDDVNATMTRCFQETALWLKRTPEELTDLFYLISKDYIPKPMTPEAATAVMNLVLGQMISQETGYHLLQRGEMADPGRTFEDEQEAIQQTPPPITPQPEGEV